MQGDVHAASGGLWSIGNNYVAVWYACQRDDGGTRHSGERTVWCGVRVHAIFCGFASELPIGVAGWGRAPPQSRCVDTRSAGMGSPPLLGVGAPPSAGKGVPPLRHLPHLEGGGIRGQNKFACKAPIHHCNEGEVALKLHDDTVRRHSPHGPPAPFAQRPVALRNTPEQLHAPQSALTTLDARTRACASSSSAAPLSVRTCILLTVYVCLRYRCSLIPSRKA